MSKTTASRGYARGRRGKPLAHAGSVCPPPPARAFPRSRDAVVLAVSLFLTLWGAGGVRAETAVVAGTEPATYVLRGMLVTPDDVLQGELVIEGAQRFDAWLTATVEEPDTARRASALEAWLEAPDALLCHPRAEHLAPLFVVAGAAGMDRGRRTYSDRIIGKAVSGFQFG